MTSMTAEAQQLFDRYLQTVRWSLRGIEGADDIERDVREHVDVALQEQSEPVSSHTLREVLARLGDPWQWVPIEELPWWRAIMMRLSLGPEDWRLAYIAFGLTILGLVLIPVGVGVFLLFGAYLIARATVALAADRQEPLGVRRWLIYPPLVFFAITFATALLIGPAAPLTAIGIEQFGYSAIFHRAQTPIVITAAVFMTFGAWWIVLSAIWPLAIRPIRALFSPFGRGFRRVHALWIAAAGLLATGAGAALMFS